jgi:hypothetical protein
MRKNPVPGMHGQEREIDEMSGEMRVLERRNLFCFRGESSK